MTTSENDATAAPKGVRLRPSVLAYIALVLALFGLIMTQWGPWKSEDDSGKRSLAPVPGEICGGLIRPQDVKEIEFVRIDEKKLEHTISGSLPGMVTCTVGADGPNSPNISVRVQPLTGTPHDWPIDPAIWESGLERVPLGPGLIGMGNKSSAWLVVPCAGGTHGDLLARADIHPHGEVDASFPTRHMPELQRPLAVLLTNAANDIATRSACGTPPLPMPDKPADPSATTYGYYCRFDADPLGPTDASTQPSPIDGCVFSSPPSDASPVFLAFRGPVAPYAPPPQPVVAHGKMLVARTAGTCVGEPHVWTTWVDPVHLRPDVIVGHDALVEEFVRQGCVVQERFAASDRPAPATVGTSTGN